jgi:tetratricopeptide (TPR) repeat protein
MVRRNVAVLHEKLGDLDIMVKDLPAAREQYLAALAGRQELAAADPYNPEPRRELSAVHGRLGLLYDQLNNVPAAREHYGKALERFEELAALNSGDAQASRDVALQYMQLGTLEQRQGNLDRAQAYHAKALKRFQELANADPNDIQANFDLARCCREAGMTAMKRHEYGEATHDFEQGVTLLRRLEASGKLKTAPIYQGFLPDQEYWLTICRMCLRAIDDQDYALAQVPSWQKVLLVVRARALASRGDHVTAATTAEKLHSLDPEDAANVYDVACCYALCAAGVAAGRAPDRLTPEESALRGRYLSRALQELAGAVQRGYKDVAHLEADSDLAALHAEKEYVQIVERLKAATAARPDP